jgi:hypothetical protein
VLPTMFLSCVKSLGMARRRASCFSECFRDFRGQEVQGRDQHGQGSQNGRYVRQVWFLTCPGWTVGTPENPLPSRSVCVTRGHVVVLG